MSKEKQIERTVEYLNNTINVERNSYFGKGCITLPLIEADKILDILKGYRKQSGWISVEERLPEDVYGRDRKQITVLVCTKSGRVSTSSRVRMMQCNRVTWELEYVDVFEWSGQIAKKVTHWMPLPEAPKGGE